MKIPESTLQGHVPSRQRNSLSTGSLQSGPDPGHTAWPASTLHQGCQPQGQGQHLGSHGETQCSTGLAATAVFCFCVVLLGSSTDCSRYGQCQCHNVTMSMDNWTSNSFFAIYKQGPLLILKYLITGLGYRCVS